MKVGDLLRLRGNGDLCVVTEVSVIIADYVKVNFFHNGRTVWLTGGLFEVVSEKRN